MITIVQILFLSAVPLLNSDNYKQRRDVYSFINHGNKILDLRYLLSVAPSSPANQKHLLECLIEEYKDYRQIKQLPSILDMSPQSFNDFYYISLLSVSEFGDYNYRYVMRQTASFIYVNILYDLGYTNYEIIEILKQANEAVDNGEKEWK